MSSPPAPPATATPAASTVTPVASTPKPAAAPRPAAPAVAPVAAARAAAPRPAATTPRPTAAPAATPAPASPPAPAKPASPWADFFRDWPAGVPRRGIVLSQQGETTPFRGFMLRGELILFERISPDSLGARFLLLTNDEVAGVKFTDPLKQDVFDAAGFTGNLGS